MKPVNLACMAKLGWRLLSDQQGLWEKILSSKYIRRNINPSKFVRKNKASIAWQGLMAATDLLQKGLRTGLYNGEKNFILETLGLETPPCHLKREHDKGL